MASQLSHIVAVRPWLGFVIPVASYSGRPTFAGQAAPCGAEEGIGSVEAAVAGSALTGAAAGAAFAVLVAAGLAEATGLFRFDGLSSA